MSTGYHIRIGYISGYSFSGGPDRAWPELLKVVDRLRGNTQRIALETARVETHDVQEVCMYAIAYGPDTEDLTLKILQADSNDEESYNQVMMMASGSERGVKEAVRRAFCRLVIEDMHRLGIEVCLEVV